MAEASLASRSRASRFWGLSAGLLSTLILLAPGGANATHRELVLVLRFPSRSIVDKGGSEDSGNYLTQDNDFRVRSGTATGSLTPLIVQDFFIRSTSPAIGGEFFSFEIEDPENPGSLAVRQDIPFTWDTDDGGYCTVRRSRGRRSAASRCCGRCGHG